jgi:hypothetical protein
VARAGDRDQLGAAPNFVASTRPTAAGPAREVSPEAGSSGGVWRAVRIPIRTPHTPIRNQHTPDTRAAHPLSGPVTGRVLGAFAGGAPSFGTIRHVLSGHPSNGPTPAARLESPPVDGRRSGPRMGCGTLERPRVAAATRWSGHAVERPRGGAATRWSPRRDRGLEVAGGECRRRGPGGGAHAAPTRSGPAAATVCALAGRRAALDD